MACLVTGASGFIGSRLCRSLAKRGTPVIALCRRPPDRLSELNTAGIEIALGDILDRDAIAAAMRKCTSCYHLAARVGQSNRQDGDFDRVNVGGTLNVLRAALKQRLSRLVYTSTAGVYGPSGNGLITENWSPEALPGTQYERSKLQAERHVLAHAQRGLHAVVVQPTRTFGPGPLTEANSLTRIMIQYARGRWRFMPGDGRHVGNYVFVDDVVRGHQQAMESGQRGQCYLLGGEDLSFNELFQLLQPYAKRHRVIRVPRSAVMLFAHACRVIAAWGKVDPLLTPEFVDKYFADYRISCQRARRELGYDPVTVAEGIRRTMLWVSGKRISRATPPCHPEDRRDD